MKFSTHDDLLSWFRICGAFRHVFTACSDTLYFTARTVGTRVRISLHVGVYVNVYAGDGDMYVGTLLVANPVLQRILPYLLTYSMEHSPS